MQRSAGLIAYRQELLLFLKAIMRGLLDLKTTIPSEKKINQNTLNAIKNYGLGAENVDAANTAFWKNKAQVFDCTVAEAKRKRCANCEYYDNTPEMLESLEAIPLNKYDIYDGQPQRGFCVKLDFICHTSRLCNAWERKDFIKPESEE